MNDEFSDIRPYNDDELSAIYDELILDEGFKNAVTTVYKDIPYENVCAMMKSCKSSYEFQKKLVYPLLVNLVNAASDGFHSDFSNTSDESKAYTFVSNHRDIVLDSALLDYALVKEGKNTVEIAIGDNLLIYPWIKKLVRVNKSFIVQRSLTMREMLIASAKMSRYMHYAINDKKSPIWIAQREGRAKDSNDTTQESVLKMMALGGEGSVKDRLASLNIVPLTISYEYDPCDYLKAKEFQLKRDIEGFKKSKADDLINMQTGIFGYKGRIDYKADKPVNEWINQLPDDMPKADFFKEVCLHMDKVIHSNYALYPGNYVAADLLEGNDSRSDKYTEQEKEKFLKYLDGQAKKIDLENPDHEFLRKKMLEMYANPVYNNEKALSAS